MLADILRGISIHIDKTPLALDDATRALYNRAITNPSSLTDAERRTITHRPSPGEEDGLCRAACGLNMSELITKATNDGDSLTYTEARLLTGGLVPRQAEKLLHERMRMSESDRDLTHRAIDAATTWEMKAAQTSAHRVRRQRHVVSSAAYQSMNDEDRKNITFAMRVPWQEHVLGLNVLVCGLVVFRAADVDDDVEWITYKQQIQTAIHHGLHLKRQRVVEAAIAKLTMHWMEENVQGNLVFDLRCRFITLRESDKFPAGLRTDSFLYVDSESLQSQDTERPFVWLWELDERAEPLKVDIKHIAPTLFARLTQRDLSPPEIRQSPYRHTSELDMLHQAARLSYNESGQRTWIWPPPARFM